MFRNVAGSIGISLSSAAVVQRSQVNQAYLVPHLTPLDHGYPYTVQAIEQGLRMVQGTGQSVSGILYSELQTQASVLAFSDVFVGCAVIAFAMVPLTLLFERVRGEASAGPG
jgi:DHA2 family multidrug resistance protein